MVISASDVAGNHSTPHRLSFTTVAR